MKNNNVKECNVTMEKNAYSGLGFTGPCATMHHQYFKMVDLLIETCTSTMKGLNACALPYAPMENNNIQIVEQKENIAEKDEEQK